LFEVAFFVVINYTKVIFEIILFGNEYPMHLLMVRYQK